APAREPLKMTPKEWLARTPRDPPTAGLRDGRFSASKMSSDAIQNDPPQAPPKKAKLRFLCSIERLGSPLRLPARALPGNAPITGCFPSARERWGSGRFSPNQFRGKQDLPWRRIRLHDSFDNKFGHMLTRLFRELTHAGQARVKVRTL